ncbi:MAG: flagellar motor protein MotB [Oligoflexia bacterium]|nr:flagellar motor protein MotB [Oligoflexia bacterium]
MAKKEDVIVVKKISAGGHGHHGGAWKVAYADFVTAMMAFFLVMWLMGSDEETKQSISHYFNHPNTPYSAGKDPNSNTSNPNGEEVGDGQNIMQGQQGMVPDDMVANPNRATAQGLSEYRDLQTKVESELQAVAYGMDLSVESMKFSINEDELFEPNSTELKPSAAKVLDKVGKVLSRFPGYVTISGNLEDDPKLEPGVSSFEFTLTRAVSVMKYLVGEHYMPEDRILPIGMGARRALASNDEPQGRQKNRRIEFTLSRTKKL